MYRIERFCYSIGLYKLGNIYFQMLISGVMLVLNQIILCIYYNNGYTCTCTLAANYHVREAFSYNGGAWGMGYVSALTYFLLSGVQILNLLQLFSKQI